MPKIKVTQAHRIHVIEVQQVMIDDWFMADTGATDETKEAMRLEYNQLEKRKQRLLNPQPKARKPNPPQTAIEGTVYVNSKPKTGRQGRGNGG